MKWISGTIAAKTFYFEVETTVLMATCEGVEPNQSEGTVSSGFAGPNRRQQNGTAELATYCVVGGAHAFILRISSFFGLAPLRFEPVDNGFVVSISRVKCIYSYTLVTVLVICTIFGLASEIHVGMDLSIRMSSRMRQIISTVDVLVVVVTAGVGVYGAPKRMRDMLKFMGNVASVDKNIGAQYSHVTERKLYGVLLSILVFFTVLLCDDFFFYVTQASMKDRQWEVVINYLGFYVLWYVAMILQLQFAFTALSVRARFRAVNDAIALTAKQVSVPIKNVKESPTLNIFAIRVVPSEIRHTNVSLLVDSLQAQENGIIIRRTATGEQKLLVSPCEAIRRLASLHGVLFDIVQKVDGSYGLPLIIILMSTLLHLIVTPYFLILELIVSTNRVHFLVLQFIWCLTHMMRILIVVEPCHYTIKEELFQTIILFVSNHLGSCCFAIILDCFQKGKRTDDLVCRLINFAPSSGMLPNRLETFSRQLLLRSVTYTPLGMCTLDRPLVASVFGAVTTYLVILIQFQRFDT